MALPLYVLLRASSLSSLMPAQCHDALLHLSNEQSSCLALELDRTWLRIYVCTDETHNKNNDDNDERQMKDHDNDNNDETHCQDDNNDTDEDDGHGNSNVSISAIVMVMALTIAQLI